VPGKLISDCERLLLDGRGIRTASPHLRHNLLLGFPP